MALMAIVFLEAFWKWFQMSRVHGLVRDSHGDAVLAIVPDEERVRRRRRASPVGFEGRVTSWPKDRPAAQSSPTRSSSGRRCDGFYGDRSEAPAPLSRTARAAARPPVTPTCGS